MKSSCGASFWSLRREINQGVTEFRFQELAWVFPCNRSYWELQIKLSPNCARADWVVESKMKETHVRVAEGGKTRLHFIRLTDLLNSTRFLLAGRKWSPANGLCTCLFSDVYLTWFSVDLGCKGMRNIKMLLVGLCSLLKLWEKARKLSRQLPISFR